MYVCMYVCIVPVSALHVKRKHLYKKKMTFNSLGGYTHDEELIINLLSTFFFFQIYFVLIYFFG